MEGARDRLLWREVDVAVVASSLANLDCCLGLDEDQDVSEKTLIPSSL